MKAKIAVTTNKNGDKVAEHAGHVVYFKIFEVDDKQGITDNKVIKVKKEHTLHNLLHTSGINTQDHEVLQSQILLTGGIGIGAINKLFQMGVRAYIIEEENPNEAVNKLINGTLKSIDPTTYQHNHHHEHSEEHDCDGHHN